MKYFTNKRLTLLFITITLLVYLALTAAGAVNNVVYISADGTGDGSSPDSPLGNAAGYVPGNKTDINNAFYLGLDKLKATGGTLVIVGDVALDSVESRFSNKDTQAVAPSEFRTPKFSSGVSVKVTSVYNGVDYREKGAELIFDYDTCNTTAFSFGCAATVEKINITYKYYEGAENAWKTPFMFGGGGYNFVIGPEVNVTSFNTKTNAPGDQYPMLIGGHRYAEVNRSYSMEVNSGTWSRIVAGSCGIKDTGAYGTINGNVSLTLKGGKFGTLVGTGDLTQPSGTIHGTLTMNLIGGEIKDFYVVHPVEFSGTKINITITKNANIDSFAYYPDDYYGDVSNLMSKITVKNTSSLVINTPETLPEETKAPTSETSVLIPETLPSPAEPSSPAIDPPEDTGPAIPPVVWLLVAIAAVVIGGATFLFNKIKLSILNK